MKSSGLVYAKFSLQLVKFLLRYEMGVNFGMVWTAFWVLSTQKCEAVIFTKFKPACVFNCFDVLVSCKAHAPCMHMCIMHGRCDITRFTHNANHVIMMSLAFTFHLCHVGMRWHAVIGVCISLTPCHHGSLCISMT